MEKAFGKPQYTFKIKSFKNVGIEWNILNLINALQKPIVNINGERLKTSPLIAETRQECPFATSIPQCTGGSNQGNQM